MSSKVIIGRRNLKMPMVLLALALALSYNQLASAAGGLLDGTSFGYGGFTAGSSNAASTASGSSASTVSQTTTTKESATSSSSAAAASGSSNSVIGGLGGVLGGVVGGLTGGVLEGGSGSAASAANGASSKTTSTITTTNAKSGSTASAASSSSNSGLVGNILGLGQNVIEGIGPGGLTGGTISSATNLLGGVGSSVGNLIGGALSPLGLGAGAHLSSGLGPIVGEAAALPAVASAVATGASLVPGLGEQVALTGDVAPATLGLPDTTAAASTLAAATTGPLAAPVATAAASLAAPGSLALEADNLANAAVVDSATAGTMVARQALSNDAIRNAQAEAAIAGADMVAHGANNARSASLASNAYRQAKLASARDRVNVAGTIQNSARISDAAIATHDAATKAEDSLLGSELAVDSAATVLDSDGAYIPPVTSSLLRSLPYGRLGIRNIVPKPLNYPSVLLPDVWLNGQPVNYFNLPLRQIPYAIGQTALTNGLYGPGLAGLTTGAANAQVLLANNGVPISDLVHDPTAAYLVGSMHGLVDSSIIPVLANGQLEAHDEIAMANLVKNGIRNGAGMAVTYNGFGKANMVPMLTGSVSDLNLQPTTTIGTTYPIGAALVIEPRDSFFQDYIDNASSRQNFDERQQ